MQEVSTDEAPPSIGPFSQAIRDNDRIYVSGQGPIDADNDQIVGDDVTEQTEQTLDNVEAILLAAESSLDNVIKATIFLIDMADYDDFNEVYGERMGDPYPARSAVQVVELPIDIKVEIEVIASVK